MGGSNDPILADVVRDDVVESVHVLDAVVVDGDGSVVLGAGDINRRLYWRSSLKPIQASVCIEQGWQPPSDAQIAVACASHNAEARHLVAVRSIFEAAGLGEEALRCPPALPLSPLVAAHAGAPARILRDCSGKHAAFLATCVARNWPIDTYLDPEHPLQRAILDRTAELGGAGDVVGVDGCGAPTPASSLRAVAAAFGRGLAASPRVHAAMRAHPFLVAGTGRVDTAVMESVPGDLVLKGGAEGLMCFASSSVGVSGAIKARDGAARAIAPATLAVLAHLALVDPGRIPALAEYANPPVLGGGTPRGTIWIRLRPV